MFTCRDGKGGKLDSLASKMLYSPAWSGEYLSNRPQASMVYRLMGMLVEHEKNS